MKNKEQFIYKATLKTRGWTNKLIEIFLPVPDKKVKNPYRSSTEASLYSLKRVEDLENNENIKLIMKNAANRKAKTKTVKNKKLQESKNQISNIISERISNGITISDTHITIHVGLTNSGKTYNALLDLKNSENGIFLCPLRLLAWENYYRLNREGFYCSLITGEERILVPNAPFTSSTVEMFDCNKTYDCVVLDESYMVSDNNRGWAFTRVLLLCKAKKLHIITSYEALGLIKSIMNRLGKVYEVKEYQRLIPLKVSEHVFDITKPVPGTVFVCFSRLEILQLKDYFDKLGVKSSVIYGNLPPEVRRRQIERFIKGETDIGICTDCIAMGVNLPCDKIVFLRLEKYDGKEVRKLTALEVKQIAGRAGRFGISKLGYGEVFATTEEDLTYVKYCLESPVVYNTFANITPELDELEILPDKRLFAKLVKWSNIKPIPEDLKDLLSITDLTDLIELASSFDQESQDVVGIESVFSLIKAPVKKDKDFWLSCCNSIINRIYLPVPKDNYKISCQDDLLRIEQEINNTEVYCWIYNICSEYKHLCPDFEKVQSIKESLVNKIDEFLLRTRKNTKVNKIITRQVKLLEQQEDQCWQEYEVPTNNKGKK